jgi:hypothetical protein
MVIDGRLGFPARVYYTVLDDMFYIPSRIRMCTR